MVPQILFEDKDIIVVVKPRGVSSQSSSGFEEDMVSLLKKHLGKDAYIGVIHRLDKPVYGIMVYGKNKKSTEILSNELRQKNIEKSYVALVEGLPLKNHGELRDYIKKYDNNTSKVVDKNTIGAKEAVLNYEVMDSFQIEDMCITRLKINLVTGRHHQIRLQCASHGFPLLGDHKYNKRLSNKKLEYDKVLALAPINLSFIHPKTNKRLNYKIDADF